MSFRSSFFQPLFGIYYNLPITIEKFIAAGIYSFFPALFLMVLSTIDHYVLLNYDNQQSISDHFNAPTIWYQLIFKGSQLLFIGTLIWLLKALNKFDKRLKAAYSAIETVNLRWLKNFTWIYLSLTLINFTLFLSQNLGFLPIEINQVFGIVCGVLVCSVFYLNYQGIQHYTLLQVYPSKGDDSTAIIAVAPEQHKINNDSDNTHLLND